MHLLMLLLLRLLLLRLLLLLSLCPHTWFQS
jgi:hypothetical protein